MGGHNRLSPEQQRKLNDTFRLTKLQRYKSADPDTKTRPKRVKRSGDRRIQITGRRC